MLSSVLDFGIWLFITAQPIASAEIPYQNMLFEGWLKCEDLLVDPREG